MCVEERYGFTKKECGAMVLRKDGGRLWLRGSGSVVVEIEESLSNEALLQLKLT